jgi:hypothetical protein
MSTRSAATPKQLAHRVDPLQRADQRQLDRAPTSRR